MKKILTRTPPLTTVQNVGIEIARIYRRTKRGEINTSDGYRMVQMLAVLKMCLETCEIERKVAEIEAALIARDNVAQFKPKAAA